MSFVVGKNSKIIGPVAIPLLIITNWAGQICTTLELLDAARLLGPGEHCSHN